MQTTIAIYDTNLHTSAQLESALIDIMRKRSMTYVIEKFQTVEGMYRELERQHFDLMFLEIGLPEMDGIEISRYIREDLKNYMVKLVYLSSVDVLAKELCNFAPIAYLTKPFNDSKVMEVMERYFYITDQSKQILRYTKRTKEYTIPCSEIMYLESNKHRIIIHTKDKKDEFYDTMDNVYNKLKDYNFLRIHKSFAVNSRFIKNCISQEVEMLDGRILPISRARRKEVHERNIQFNNGKND